MTRSSQRPVSTSRVLGYQHTPLYLVVLFCFNLKSVVGFKSGGWFFSVILRGSILPHSLFVAVILLLDCNFPRQFFQFVCSLWRPPYQLLTASCFLEPTSNSSSSVKLPESSRTRYFLSRKCAVCCLHGAQSLLKVFEAFWRPVFIDDASCLRSRNDLLWLLWLWAHSRTSVSITVWSPVEFEWTKRIGSHSGVDWGASEQDQTWVTVLLLTAEFSELFVVCVLKKNLLF